MQAPKGMLVSLALGKAKGDKPATDAESKDDEAKENEGAEAAAGDVLAAIKADDKAALSAALKAHCELCH